LPPLSVRAGIVLNLSGIVIITVLVYLLAPLLFAMWRALKAVDAAVRATL